MIEKSTLDYDVTINSDGRRVSFSFESDKAKEVLKQQSATVQKEFKQVGNRYVRYGIDADKKQILKNFCRKHGLRYLNI